MKSDIIIIGGGASGLMAAYSAADTAVLSDRALSVTVLEKMPRPARKIMITGKGRCNFTNVKDWESFSSHVRSNPGFIKSAFFSLPPQKLIDFFDRYGMQSVVERGDRAFPSSYRASDVVDTLVNACLGRGVKIECGVRVDSVKATGDTYELSCVRIGENGEESPFKASCSRLIVATGGLSYTGTGSTGDGLRWASELGLKVQNTFPSLTALVPKGYKNTDKPNGPDSPRHIHRDTPLSETGRMLCGIQLKNTGVTLEINGTPSDSDTGEIYFTDGGIEGPVGFQLSRKAVKALVNGAKVALVLNLKPGVPQAELDDRISRLNQEIEADPRSRNLSPLRKFKVLLGKLMPRELVEPFLVTTPPINAVNLGVNLLGWRFDLAGHVGYERAVITAGGIDCSELTAKTMESKLHPGLYFCGEVTDADCDTGGYNLQTAFCTGNLAGINAAKSLVK